jgi:hypothetical protein
VETKNRDLGTYSCKLDRHRIAFSLSLKGLEGKSVVRNLLRLQIRARILSVFRFRYTLSDTQTATYQV